MHERAYVASVRRALATRDDLTAHEAHVLETEVAMIEAGNAGLTEPQTVEDRLQRLRDHYP